MNAITLTETSTRAASFASFDVHPWQWGLFLGFIAVLGFNLYYLHRDGQTLGKKVVGIRILRSDTSTCELWRVSVQRFLPISLLGAIPLLGPLISLVDALMIFGEERRCLHDLIADTIVVDV